MPTPRPSLPGLRRRGAPALYAALGLAVAAPLLGRGLVLAVDLSLPPHPHLASSYWGVPESTHVGPPSRLLLDALFVALGKIDAVAAGEQAMLFAIVFLAGWGMHRAAPVRSTWARVFAGVLFALNPFVYDRLYTGQWFLLLGYALLPWTWSAFVRLLRGSWRDALPFGLLLAGVGIASAHVFALALLLCLLAALAESIVVRAPAAAARGAAGAVLGALLSLYWLLPSPGVSELWRTVGPAQLAFYETVRAGGWGIVATVLGLGGYWNDVHSVDTIVRWWPLPAAALVLVAVAGVVRRRRDPLAAAVALAALAGLLLALGHASGVTRPAFDALLRGVTPVRSFRESQKGVLLLVFAYAYLGAAAVEWGVEALRRPRVRACVAVAAVAVPAVLGFRVLGGLWGRLEPSAFPDGWNAARTALARDGAQSRALFVPWQGYVDLSFAHYRVVSNPAPQFFTTPVLASQFVGAGGVSETTDPVEARVDALLGHAGDGTSLAACLARLGVGHVLVADEIGSLQLDDVLRAQPGFTLEGSWPGIDLFRLDAPGGLAMAARGGGACGPVGPVRVTRLDPAHVRIDGPVPSRLLLGLPDAARWRLHGRTLVYGPWSTYRRNYVVGALAALLALAAAAVLGRRSR